MIAVNGEIDFPVPSRSVVIIDPAARSVLGRSSGKCCRLVAAIDDPAPKRAR